MTPTNDAHEMAVALLHSQADRQLALPPGHVFTDIAWKVAGASSYVNVPDLTVLEEGWRRVEEWDLEPPPLLVAEIASPSTRRADRGRKLADYRLGGAGLYLLVDLPGAAQTGAALEVHDFTTETTVTVSGAIDVLVGERALRFDLSELSAF